MRNSAKKSLRIHPLSERVSDFSRTKSIAKRVVLEDVPSRLCAYLEISVPQADPAVVALDEHELVLGRSSACRVQLQLPGVSRLHALLTCRNGEHLIEDLESTNGTFVNGVRVQKCVLRDSDQIQIGEANILFLEERLRPNR